MLFNVQIPAEATIFFSYIFQICAFDPIPTDDLYAYVFNFENEPFNARLDNAGYGSMFIIKNLGSLFLLLVLIPPFLLLAKLVVIASTCKPKVVSWFRKQLDGMIWNGLITMFSEAYLVLCVVCKLNQQVILKPDTVPEYMSAALAMALDISLVIVPLTLYILFWQKWNAVNLDLVKAVDDLILYDRYGELLRNFDPERIGKAKCLNFFMWGFIRRYLLVVSIIDVQKYPQF